MKSLNGMNASRAKLLAAVSLAGLLGLPLAAAAQTGAGTATGDAGTTDPDRVAAPDQAGEEPADIVVTGIRASQARAIEVKRNADSVVEAISAQDIGKLPDVTISDSLQRIPGVQIRRDAGEGAAVNIRGLPQVTTLLNGEQFLGANSVTTVQPNFTDIPSQLFSGATVYKSPTASLQQAGLTGTIDLLTRRPFDLKQGLTFSAAGEGQYGDKTEKWNPSFNGLVAFHGERVGLLVSASYSDLTLANSFRGVQDYGVSLRNESGSATNQGDFAVGNNGVSRGSPVRDASGNITGYDVNGDGDANDAFITPQSHTAWNRITDRQRFGANASLQFEINDALRLTADGFYTRQTQYDRTAGFQFQNIDWLSSPFSPTKSRDTGATSGGYNVNTVQQYSYSLPNFDSYSETFRTKSESQNYNVQLDWKPTDTFKATVRGIYGKANRERDQSYTQFSLTNGRQWGYQADGSKRTEGVANGGLGNYPASVGGDRTFNPTGYQVYGDTATVDYSSGVPVFGFSPGFLAQAGDASRYGLKTVSSEGNVYQKGDIWAFRADGEWQANDQLKVAFGARYGERSVNQFTFDRVSPIYAGNTDNAANPAAGCLVKWKAFDVNLDDKSCPVYDSQGRGYTAGLTRQATDPIFAGMIKQYQLPAAGAPTLWALDPKAMDDSESWQNKFYPGSQNLINPALSFDVNTRQISGYAQVSGEGELLGMPFRANGGLQVVSTRLNVRQNIVGVPQPYGVAGVDSGDVRTERQFTDFLPSINVAFDVTDKLRARAAFSKTMTLLDFQQWGGGLNVNYAINTATNLFEARTADSLGNPNLNPWRATNVEGSLEYYTGRSSLIAAGAFYIAVDSFIDRTTELRSDIPDNDGVIRRQVVTNTFRQGEGGTLKGVEVSARQSLADYGVNGLFGGFGVDANYTLSLGDAGLVDLAGNNQPFQDNSKHQVNAALWFEKYGLQARVAYNYRSKRLVSSNYGGIDGLAQYQQPTNYLDASISYDVTPFLTLYGQASNLTAETERYYLTWPDQVLYENIYERRFIAGARVRF
jgi:TonB-dependent receptor